MISTGNLQVDYAITYTVQSLYTVVQFLIVQFHVLLINYPDVASLLLVIGGAFVGYYIIKNFVRIVYGLFVTLIKLLIVCTLAFVALWVYVRGVDTFTSDFKKIVDFTSNFQANSSQVQQYEQQAKSAWGLVYQWAANQVDH